MTISSLDRWRITFSLEKLVRISFFLILLAWGLTTACTKGAVQNLVPTIGSTPTIPNETILAVPDGVTFDPSCPKVDEQPGFSEIDKNKAEISFVLKDVAQNQIVDFALINTNRNLVWAKRLCTSSPAFVHLQVDPQDARFSFIAREQGSGRIFYVEDARGPVGRLTNFGLIQGSQAHTIKGQVLNANGAELLGEIQELGWKFRVENDGKWQTGALPSGQWSIKISDNQNLLGRWLKIPIGNKAVEIPPFPLNQNSSFLVPLWSGVLNEVTAQFLINAPLDVSEIRMSFNPGFVNSFWSPFRQVMSVPVPSSGRHILYSQVRNLSGEESKIEIFEFSASVLELDSQADAVLGETVLSVFSPSTIVSTIPPEGATHHSLVVDNEDISPIWVQLDTQLVISLPSQIESCGHHFAYIRFKDSAGKESPALKRNFSVRCWERDFPNSTLEPRYNHGSGALSFVNEGDAVFIWGGQNQNNDYFSNGAIIKHESDEIITKSDGSQFTKPVWTWQPIAPSPLSERSHPKVVVGKNHVLVYGGFAPNGDILGDWAFYNYRTNSWIDSSGFDALSVSPTAVKNAATGYILAENNALMGAFFLVGGEKQDQPKASTISNKVYTIVENDGVIEKRWYEKTYTVEPLVSLGGSRASYSVSPDRNFLFIFGGIMPPTGVLGSIGNSGDDFDTTAAVIVFSFNANIGGGGNTYDFPLYLYHSNGGRKTAALNGQVFIIKKPVNPSDPVKKRIESHSMCVFGAQKYSDVFPEVCDESRWVDGEQHLYGLFCRRIYDSYLFAPVARAGVCFQPIPPHASDLAGAFISGYLSNIHMAIPSAPQERRLNSVVSPILQGNSGLGALFFWSGMAATGGEYLADGSIFLSREDKWVPITSFEALNPRNFYSAVFLNSQKRIFVWGGLTASGATSGGAFYAMP